MDGVLNLDKPAGISSARAVAMVKQRLGRGVKVGHAGTLDPFATGVLVVLAGRATRLCQRFMAMEKEYEAVIRLGATTPTDDPESPVQPWPAPIDPRALTQERVAEALGHFVGEITQRPPDYSALKISGRRAYKLARSGKPVDLRPRPVRVDRIDLLAWEWPHARVRIVCGQGTYIRAIARDVGELLNTGGYLTQLRRTRIGALVVKDAATLDDPELTARFMSADVADRLWEQPSSP